MGALEVVAAAVLDPRGLLLVSKRAAPHVFFLPGGKPEDGESALECLDRELREEPASASEIASIAWWREGQALGLAPAVRHEVIPRLRRVVSDW